MQTKDYSLPQTLSIDNITDSNTATIVKNKRHYALQVIYAKWFVLLIYFVNLGNVIISIFVVL